MASARIKPSKPAFDVETWQRLVVATWLETPDKAMILPPPFSIKCGVAVRYDYECRRVGLSAMHGLRHADAQRRYYDLTGYDAPVLGGRAPKDLDQQARGVITEELGHDRLEIVASYIGRLPAISNEG